MSRRGIVVQGHVIHDRMACRARLEADIRMSAARMQARMASEAESALPQGGVLRPDRPAGRPGQTAAMRGQEAAAAGKKGGALKRAQADEALSDLRKAAICRCLDGKCERPSGTASTQCSGCPRRLHVATCGGFGSARAAAGVLKCFYCRASDMAPDQVPTAARLDAAMVTMVIQLSLGQEGTAAAAATFNQLEQDFALQQGLEGQELLLARHRVHETFLAFTTYCFRDAGRARLMKALWRTLPSLFKVWELPDLTMHYEVRKHFKEMQDQWSEEPDPASACTERMTRLLLTEVIPGQRSNRLLATRDVVSSGVGAYAGTRIGETVDSGQGHLGVTCPHVCVVRGGLLSYADHYALRVGLHGVDDYNISRMLQKIAVSWCRSAKIHATTTSIYAARRAHASGKGSETKKWVYVAAGRGDDTSMEQLRLARDAEPGAYSHARPRATYHSIGSW